MEKLNKVIVGLECCLSDADCDKCCPYFKGEYKLDGCMDEMMAEALEVLKEYKLLLQRNSWPCWQCEYALARFNKYRVMLDPDTCDLHRDKMCPVLDEEVADGIL